jgi:hypothetical protein
MLFVAALGHSSLEASNRVVSCELNPNVSSTTTSKASTSILSPYPFCVSFPQ